MGVNGTGDPQPAADCDDKAWTCGASWRLSAGRSSGEADR